MITATNASRQPPRLLLACRRERARANFHQHRHLRAFAKFIRIRFDIYVPLLELALIPDHQTSNTENVRAERQTKEKKAAHKRMK